MASKNPEEAENDTHKSEIGSKKVPYKMAHPRSPTYGSYPPPPPGTKRHLKNQNDLDTRHGDMKIKQHSKVNYLGCILDNNLSGEFMATKVLSLVNGRLKFLCREQNFLTHSLCRLLCNALIQPYYDYACTAWCPSLNKKLSKNSKHPWTSVLDIV